MSKLFTGSICLTDLIENARKLHSAFSKSQNNGKVYCNILIWENDEVDKYGNIISLQLNSTKEKKDTEEKVYIGNAKTIESKPVSYSDLPKDNWDSNIPVRELKQKDSTEIKDPASITEPIDDLPF